MSVMTSFWFLVINTVEGMVPSHAVGLKLNQSLVGHFTSSTSSLPQHNLEAAHIGGWRLCGSVPYLLLECWYPSYVLTLVKQTLQLSSTTYLAICTSPPPPFFATQLLAWFSHRSHLFLTPGIHLSEDASLFLKTRWHHFFLILALCGTWKS